MIKHPIPCKGTRRKLAMIDKDNIYFLCKTCKIEHPISRNEIMQMWHGLDKMDGENRQAIDGICKDHQ